MYVYAHIPPTGSDFLRKFRLHILTGPSSFPPLSPLSLSLSLSLSSSPSPTSPAGGEEPVSPSGRIYIANLPLNLIHLFSSSIQRSTKVRRIFSQHCLFPAKNVNFYGDKKSVSSGSYYKSVKTSRKKFDSCWKTEDSALRDVIFGVVVDVVVNLLGPEIYDPSPFPGFRVLWKNSKNRK